MSGDTMTTLRSICRGRAVRFQVPRPDCDPPSGLPPTTGERVWGCAMSRWPSLLPRCSDARLAPERSPRLEGVWHLLFPLSALPVTGLAALFLPYQGLAVSAIRG